MSLEKIIRPFQTRDISPPRAVLSANIAKQTENQPVEIVIGKSWSIKSINGSETIDITYYMERWMKEKRTAT